VLMGLQRLRERHQRTMVVAAYAGRLPFGFSWPASASAVDRGGGSPRKPGSFGAGVSRQAGALGSPAPTRTSAPESWVADRQPAGGLARPSTTLMDKVHSCKCGYLWIALFQQ
jgi:hypothetical protein